MAGHTHTWDHCILNSLWLVERRLARLRMAPSVSGYIGPRLETFPCTVIALGYTSGSEFAGAAMRTQIRQTHAALAPPGNVVCLSFVFGSQPPTHPHRRRAAQRWPEFRERTRAEDAEPPNHRGPPRQLWADVADDDAKKVLHWFTEAARQAWAPFIGKADDDAFIQPAHLAADLEGLTSMSLYGAFQLMPDWRAEGAGHSAASSAGHPCGRPLPIEHVYALSMRQSNPWKRKRKFCRESLSERQGPGLVPGPFPWASGPLEVVGLTLAQRVLLSPAVQQLCATQSFSFKGNSRNFLHGANGTGVDVWGEDPIIGYLVHFAAYLEGFNYTIAHMTNTKLHNHPPFHVMIDPKLWTLPDTSLVVHRLKLGHGAEAPFHDWLRAATRRFHRCFPPFLFRWQPRAHTLHNLGEDAWKRYTQISRGSTFGVHWLRNDTSGRRKEARAKRLCAGGEESVHTAVHSQSESHAWP
jgi:hypothetical protein